jgi:molybdopterin-guanine dinucleotide biosynthesis adapter protein
MAVVKPFVFQVVGFQNSGKTTLINKLLEQLNKSNIKAGIIKHHGHGGKPDINENKDSSQYLRSGACVSIVEGEGRLLLQAEEKNWSLNNQINILRHFELDVIIVEGHKFEEYPKAILIRDEQDLFILDQLDNIVVLFLRNESDRKFLDTHVTTLSLNQSASIFWMVEYIKSQLTGK